MLGLIVALVVGGLAGWLASMVVGRDSSLGVIGNIIVGFLGAGIANFFGGDTHLSHPTFVGFLLAVLGAVVLLAIVNLFTRNKIR